MIKIILCWRTKSCLKLEDKLPQVTALKSCRGFNYKRTSNLLCLGTAVMQKVAFTDHWSSSQKCKKSFPFSITKPDLIPFLNYYYLCNVGCAMLFLFGHLLLQLPGPHLLLFRAEKQVSDTREIRGEPLLLSQLISVWTNCIANFSGASA